MIIDSWRPPPPAKAVHPPRGKVYFGFSLYARGQNTAPSAHRSVLESSCQRHLAAQGQR